MLTIIKDYACKDDCLLRIMAEHPQYGVRAIVGVISPDTTEDDPQPWMVTLMGRIVRDEEGGRMYFACPEHALDYVSGNMSDRIRAFLASILEG